jgi:hypothetical protein
MFIKRESKNSFWFTTTQASGTIWRMMEWRTKKIIIYCTGAEHCQTIPSNIPESWYRYFLLELCRASNRTEIRPFSGFCCTSRYGRLKLHSIRISTKIIICTGIRLVTNQFTKPKPLAKGDVRTLEQDMPWLTSHRATYCSSLLACTLQ